MNFDSATAESLFFEQTGEARIGLRNREVPEIGGKIKEKCYPRETQIGSKQSKRGVSGNRGFEK